MLDSRTAPRSDGVNSDPSDPRPIEECVRIVSWRDGATTETRDAGQLHAILADPDCRVWIDLTEPAPEIVESIGGLIGLHPLVAEDIIQSNERAKVELVGDIVHIVMFALTREGETQTHEIDFVMSHRLLLSVHPASWDPHSVHQLKLGIGTILGRGTDFLLWALTDGIIDAYFPVFDQFADEIDEVQDQIIANATPDTLNHVFQLKRELIHIRHVIAPTREIFGRLTGREFEMIGDAQVFYFRDVYDHLIRLTDEFDSFRELVAGALDVYLSTINNNLSSIMKRLTGVTVILAGIGAVAGLFGMSEATPAFAGLEGFGFYAITVGAIVLGVVAVVFLRRIDWI
jgi:magnesium transporter